MLSPHPMDRPSARFCEERVYEILTNNAGVEGTHCGSARMRRVVGGMVEVARAVPEAGGEAEWRGQSWFMGRGSRSGSASQSGSKSSGSGAMGRGIRERPKARPWKAPIYSGEFVCGYDWRPLKSMGCSWGIHANMIGVVEFSFG